MSAVLERIRALIPTPLGETIWQGRRRDAERYELQRQCAESFGQAHGWRLTDRDFSPTVLARRGSHGTWAPWPMDFVDHPYFYRSERRAAAVAAHVYDLEEERTRAWAVSEGLMVSFPSGSWWFPGWTRLVLFEPRRRA